MIGGGLLNNVFDHANGTIGGGTGNSLIGQSGGFGSGYGGTVPGGVNNTAGGNYSFAAGHGARVYNNASFVWNGYNNPAPSFFDQRFHVYGQNGLSVNYSAQRGDGDGSKWIVLGSIGQFAGQAISTSTGAYLGDDGIWHNASDRNRKTDFAATDARDILHRLATLPVQTWRYTNEAPTIRHLGPTAQDFSAAFGLGSDDKSIGTLDESGVALAAIQGLNELVAEKDARITALESELAALKKQLAGQQDILARWEIRFTVLEQAAARVPQRRITRVGIQARAEATAE